MTNGKQKGNRFERYLVKRHEEVYGIPFERTFRSGGGAQKGDIAPIQGHDWPFVIEAKHREGCWTIDALVEGKGAILSWWTKIKEEARSINRLPQIFAKRNRRSTMVMVCELGFQVLREWYVVETYFRGNDLEGEYYYLIPEDTTLNERANLDEVGKCLLKLSTSENR